MKKLETCLLKCSALVVALFALTSCGVQPTVTIAPTPSQTANATDDANQALELPGLNLVPTLAEIVPTRTPVPTSTPDALTEEIIQIVQETGLSQKTLFWLGFADWINLGISLLYVLAGYLIGTWLIRWLLPRLVNRTKTNLDDRLLQVSANELRWLAVVLIFRFSIARLIFVHPNVKSFIADICFFLIVFLIALLFWRLINLAAQHANERTSKIEHQREADSLITLITWTLRLIVIISVIILTLSHFGVNITGFAFILGVIILLFSLAGRDILTDIISGAMILIDQPFRIGDRLELPSLDSWGDVVEIGMRSTKILSMENRMVVLPNSVVGKNQVINYSYPDPSYLDITNVLVAYDNDVEQVQKIMAEAILSVDGVQKEREIYTLLMELNETHMLFWAGWWIESYQDRFPVHSEVSKAIIQKLKEAGVVLPYRRTFLNPKTDPDSDTKTTTVNTQE
jgi:small-conductance mechanosensitive channel